MDADNSTQKGTNEMNYRDHNPELPCLPPSAYYALAKATATRTMNPAPPSPLRRITRFLATLLPILGLGVFAYASRVPEGPSAVPLVWVQPKPGKDMPPPPVLPAVGDPRSL